MAVPPRVREAALRAYERGAPVEEIARIAGVEVRTVHAWAAAAKVRRHPLSDAETYDGDLTPEQNRRRLNRLRAIEGAKSPRGGRSFLPGQAPNAGQSQRMVEERRRRFTEGTGEAA